MAFGTLLLEQVLFLIKEKRRRSRKKLNFCFFLVEAKPQSEFHIEFLFSLLQIFQHFRNTSNEHFSTLCTG